VNGVAARGTLVFVAGQIGWDAQQHFQAQDLPGQTRQALENVLAVLAEAGAGPEHVARMTWYVTSRDEYLRDLARVGEAWRATMGRHYPPMSVVQVAALVEAQAKIEIEATAVVPETPSG
jgi:enamine deaminase RidA (YjgF/YER057c/UK114 family)